MGNDELIYFKGPIFLLSFPSHYHWNLTFETPTVSTSNSTTSFPNNAFSLNQITLLSPCVSFIYICVCAHTHIYIHSTYICHQPLTDKQKCWFIFLTDFKNFSNLLAHIQDCSRVRRLLLNRSSQSVCWWRRKVLDLPTKKPIYPQYLKWQQVKFP